MPAKVASVILAAGRGSRMKSDCAKVLHRVANKSMLSHVIDASLAADIYNIIVVTGHQKRDVEAEATQTYAAVHFCEQKALLGTGHAVAQAQSTLQRIDADIVVVMCGDTPLIGSDNVRRLVSILEREPDNAACVLTAFVDNPFGLGRVLRDSHSGRVHRIVEERDCQSDAERAVREVNSGTYAFRRKALQAALAKIDCNNAQREYYLTDAVRALVEQGELVHAVCLDEHESHKIIGVNTLAQLARAERLLA
jgi:UDP-N-acetylglucosamine diphosphorylase/glucosamine-1-phosphate N-acetyltransferase